MTPRITPALLEQSPYDNQLHELACQWNSAGLPADGLAYGDTSTPLVCCC